MSLFYKLLFGLVVILSAAAGGFFLGKGKKEIQVVEKVGTEKIVYRDRIVTVTRTTLPDGTTTEQTRTEDLNRTETRRDTETSRIEKSVLAQYRLGISQVIEYKNPLLTGLTQVSVSAGRRILGPVWVDVGASKNQATLGLSWEL